MMQLVKHGNAAGNQIELLILISKISSMILITHLLMRAVRKHTQCKWLLLYIERWITSSMQNTDGQLQERKKSVPQGGVISPLLANLFLHYAFDHWMKINYSNVKFERYADDIIVHCSTEMENIIRRHYFQYLIC